MKPDRQFYVGVGCIIAAALGFIALGASMQPPTAGAQTSIVTKTEPAPVEPITGIVGSLFGALGRL